MINDASLVMIPSGYKDGKLYSVKPTNGDGDFTFSRGSNLAATRVNSEGLIEKGRENLLLQSNTFDTTWTLNNSSLTSGQSGYDGSNDAWELTSISTSSARVQQFESNTGVQSLSIYAKAGTANFILAEKAGTNGYYAWFDLSNGTIGNTSGDINTTIEDVGNGWYRCSISGNPSASSKSQFYVAETNGSSTISVGASIYIQDAQLEQGLVATEYIETTTTTAQAGILEDMPRLDYSGGSCPALLLEPQRSNELTFSDYLSGSFWFDNDITRTQNTNEVLSPEGVYNAVKLTETATTARHRLASNTISISTSNYTASVFLKMGTARYGFLNIGGVATIVVDLQEGVITDSRTSGTIINSDIEDYGNGWYRLSVAHSLTAVSTSYLFQFGTAGSAQPTIYNNYIPQFLGSTSNNIYAYGAMLEAGSYPTSYIPTYGSSVTRGEDDCSKTGISSLIGQTEGVVFMDWIPVVQSPQTHFSMSDGGSDVIGFWGAGVFVFYTSGGCSITGGSITAGERVKVAFAYKNNDFVAYVNGTQVGTDTSGSVPTCDRIFIGEWINGTEKTKQSINQLLLFPTRLTNDELAALTTL